MTALRTRSAPLLAAAALALLLGACSESEQAAPAPEADPALAGALGDQITIDPDLAGQNGAAEAVALPGNEGALPTIDLGPEAAGRARTDALALVGGPGKMRKAPEPREAGGTLPPEAALSAAARAANAPGTGDCAAKAEYSAAWAAKLPQAFPVYPRGAVQEAAGTDVAPCSLRVVNFLTPVPIAEVMDFYYTRAAAAGFSSQRVLQDGDDVMGGVKTGASFTVYARRLPSGATEVDLVTSGR